MMGEGVDARAILSGLDPHVPKLRLGYVGVMNRNQKEVAENKSMMDARITETRFFEARYPTVINTGMAFLVKSLSTQLIQCIQVPIITSLSPPRLFSNLCFVYFRRTSCQL